MRTTHPLLIAVWVALALTTLYLVVQTDNALVAALVAWTGGLLTHALGLQMWQRHRT